jgi:Holliday junction resolvase RusA-like endonuclease
MVVTTLLKVNDQLGVCSSEQALSCSLPLEKDRFPPSLPPSSPLFLHHGCTKEGIRADALMMTNSDEQLIDDDQIIFHIEIKDKPLVAERPRFRYLLPSRRAYCYDLCQANKHAIWAAVRQALEECGITRFPFFVGKELKVVVTFYVKNRRKDVDNLLKFVSDALQTVVYKNDSCIFDVHAKKKAVQWAEEESTTIKIEVNHE